ncbi:MAG: hypothetical protein V4621_07820 [Pseudomonadota bacterium]
MKASDLNNPIQRKVAEFMESNLNKECSYAEGVELTRSILLAGITGMIAINGKEATIAFIAGTIQELSERGIA